MNELEILEIFKSGQCIYGVTQISRNELTIHKEVNNDKNEYGILSWCDGARFFVENAEMVEIYEVIKATNERQIYRVDAKLVKKNDCIENSVTTEYHQIFYRKSELRKMIKKYFKGMKKFIHTGFNEQEELTNFLNTLSI
jgi:hypothetical protein